ncbi:MAG: hypothetical protein AAFU38_12410 [Bacteroidota bacterium]
MLTTLAPDRPVRHNQYLDYEAIRRECSALVESYAGTQTKLAKALGYTPAYVSRAKSEVGPNIVKVQREIIALLSDYTIEEEATVKYRVVRKTPT